MSKREFSKKWNVLKQPKQYEYELADYMIHAIAHCTQKDILIFNTKPEGTYDPIFVIKASKPGGRPANTDIPVLLAYNDVHFEGLFPDTRADEIKTIELKKSYLANTYTFKKRDIPIFWQLKAISEEQQLLVSEVQPPKKKLKDMTIYEKESIKK